MTDLQPHELRSRIAVDVALNVELQSAWIDEQHDHDVNDAIADWRHRAQGWIAALRELDEHTAAAQIEKRLGELARTRDNKAANAVMAKIAQDLQTAFPGRG